MKNLKPNRGFTLIELLMVLGVTAVVSVMIVNFFLINLRAAAKNKALTEVKQSGDYALAVMERLIRNSQAIQSCGSNSLTITNIDGGTTTFSLSANQIASNSASLISHNLQIKAGTFSLSCRGTTPEVVTASFTLQQNTTAGGREFSAEVPFQLQVSTRNY